MTDKCAIMRWKKHGPLMPAAFPLHQGITDGENTTSNHANRPQTGKTSGPSSRRGHFQFTGWAWAATLVGSMSPSPLSSFARLTWAVPCNLELISRLWSRSPSPRLHSRMTWWWANGSGKILDTFKQLCASWALEKTLVNLKEAFIEQMGSARFASSFTWDMKSASYLGHGDQFLSIMRTIWDEESPTKLRWI